MTDLPPTTPPVPDATLLMAVLDIARHAGQAIMRVYASEFAVEHKADESPLTLADREAHRIITAGLQSLTPQYPVLSEESSPQHHDFATRRQWQTLWLVDPLDGTREFVKRNGEFTVNIALIHAHRPALGVITVPAADMAYTGAIGLGATRIRGTNAAEIIRVRQPHPAVPVIVGSRSHRGASTDALLARLGPHELCAVGSALKFCRVAEGNADLYPRLSPTSEWDTAAGQAILEAAGGQVVSLQGEPLTYNHRDTLLNPDFLAIGDPHFAWQPLITTGES
jgi:3'(2'), 5'-bisphosphate nucleotidase